MLYWRGFNSASDLKLLRRQAGLSQAQLGRGAGFSRDTVSYWERHAGRIDGHAPLAFRQYLEGMGIYVPANGEPPVAGPKPEPTPTTCAAKTRKGAPCKCKPEHGKRRCKFHGGKSTGPKTAEGRQRIAEAQRKRWARYSELSAHYVREMRS